MTDIADYAETEIRDWMSQGTDVDTAPGTVYVALHTGTAGDDGSTNEVGAADYDRVGVTAGSGWDTPTSNSFENASEISFGAATSDWGTVEDVSLWDAQTGGNCLVVGDLSTSKAIDTDDEATFAAGDFTFTID